MKRTYHDPITGDELSAGERASWLIQSIIRRWLFLGVLATLTGYVWIVADPIWRHPLTDQWNLWASWLAIVIESVTAMALINQARRDAVILRHTAKSAETQVALEQQNRALLERLVRVEEQNEQQTAMLVQVLREQRLIRVQTGALQDGERP